MKVILMQDIAKIGKKYDVAEVANGYAEFLIKQGKVEMATPAKLKNIKSKQEAIKVINKQETEKLQKAIKQIVKEGISLVLPANEKGHLFEQVTKTKIKDAIADSIVEIPESVIDIDSPIKEIGEYEITLKNGEDIHKAKLVITPSE